MMTTASFDAVSGVLTVTGGSAADAITISRNAAGVILVNDGAIAVTGGTPTVANTTLIEISVIAGNDIVTLNESFGALPPTSLVAGSGHDTETGGSGGDTLLGESGNDILLGKGGFDVLFGGDGNDTLTGGDADDQLFGQGGNDRMIWNPGDDSDLFEGGDGTDTAEVNGGNGAEVFVITANGTRVRFDRVDPAPFALDIGTTENLVLRANGGDDTVTASGNLAALIGLTIDGGAGNDTLGGGNGADLLIGGDGNDVVDGAQGSDHALLGAGDDRFVWDPGDGSDAVEGDVGVDTLAFNGSGANENIIIAADGRRTLITRDVGAITMDLLDIETINVNALGGTDTITVRSLTATPVTQIAIDLADSTGTAGDGQADRVIVDGTRGSDALSVAGSGGTVTVAGLSALITIAHSEAGDSLTVNGAAGNDVIEAFGLAAGNTSLFLDGGIGNDTLIGSTGADILLGGDGNDLITGRLGNDLALMGAGNDVFTWNPGDGNDTVEGQDGTDTLAFIASGASENIDIAANGGRVRLVRDVAAITMDMNDVERITHHALGGADATTINDLSGTDVTQVAIDLAGTIGGTAGDGEIDTVVANITVGDDVVSLRGSNGTVIVEGIAAPITITHSEAADRIIVNGLGGADTLNAASLAASTAAPVLDGGAGDDTLTGGGGSDILLGGDGDDIVTGKRSNDLALLGVGNDHFGWTVGDGSDTVEGQAGDDQLDVGGTAAAQAFSLFANGGRATVQDDNAGAILDVDDIETIAIAALGGKDAITVHDLAGTDVTRVAIDLAGTPGGSLGDGQVDQVTINGTVGDDVVELGAEDGGVTALGLAAVVAITHAEAGDQIFVNGDSGVDFLLATAPPANGGQFIFDGGTGNDVIVGGGGNDVVIGAAGADNLDGGTGVDTLDYSQSPDAVTIDIRLNTATGGDATGDSIDNFETVLGSGFADTITGSAGINLLAGGQGNDTMTALGGNDSLAGDVGNDLLTGGGGLDTLTGGTGADLFIYVAAADSTVAAPDVINDFHRSHRDKIDVTAIDANTLLGGDQAFSFINTAAFGGNQGELRITYGADFATVSGDINGNGTADFAITLAGIDAAHPLAVSDFLL